MLLNDLSAGDQPIDHHDSRHHEQQMDETAANVQRQKAKRPEDKQNNDNSPKHDALPTVFQPGINARSGEKFRGQTGGLSVAAQRSFKRCVNRTAQDRLIQVQHHERYKIERIIEETSLRALHRTNNGGGVMAIPMSGAKHT